MRKKYIIIFKNSDLNVLYKYIKVKSPCRNTLTKGLLWETDLEQLSSNDSEMEVSPFSVHNLGLIAPRSEKDTEMTSFINIFRYFST